MPAEGGTHVQLDPRSLGLYVITSDRFVPGRSHRDVTLAAIEGGATAVQLRAPELSPQELLPLATELAERCREAGVLFIVNDRVTAAVGSGAAGAHVGQGDDPTSARALLGVGPVLGISVSTPEEAKAAEAAGADYLGVTVWATPTKSDAIPRGIDGVLAVVGATRLPVVGVGGINAGNAHQVLETGAAGVAVVAAIGAAPDMVAATRKLAEVVGVERRGA
jgi:thiamine-phosphate diphosphorylase